MVYKINIAHEFTVHDCLTCGISYAMTDELDEKRKKDYKSFHCPNGHKQYYSVESKEGKLKKQLKFIEKEHEQCMTNLVDQVEERDAEIKFLTASRGSIRGVLNKLKKKEA